MKYSVFKAYGNQPRSKDILLVIAILLTLVTSNVAVATEEPYSCKEYREAQKKCSYNSSGPCYVQRDMEHYRQQCIREGGRP